jgi:hypothetical protein
VNCVMMCVCLMICVCVFAGAVRGKSGNNLALETLLARDTALLSVHFCNIWSGTRRRRSSAGQDDSKFSSTGKKRAEDEDLDGAADDANVDDCGVKPTETEGVQQPVEDSAVLLERSTDAVASSNDCGIINTGIGLHSANVTSDQSRLSSADVTTPAWDALSPIDNVSSLDGSGAAAQFETSSLAVNHPLQSNKPNFPADLSPENGVFAEIAPCQLLDVAMCQTDASMQPS